MDTARNANGDAPDRRAIERRHVLRTLGCALSGLFAAGSVAGCSRRRPAAGVETFAPLETPATVPLASVGELWAAAFFSAPLKLSAARTVRIPGIVVRVRAGGAVEDSLRAFSRICPHELCTVNYLTEPGGFQLDAGVERPEHPLIVCPCHFSVFDPLADGRRLGGPAERGAYRFRFHAAGEHIELTHVESGVRRLFGPS